jgi:hypothetical protein
MDRRLGLYYGPYSDHLFPFDEVIRQLADLRIYGVELSGYPPHPNPDDLPTPEQHRQVVDQVRALRLSSSGLESCRWGE